MLDSNVNSNVSVPIAQRRTRRKTNVPKRYRTDVLPMCPASLPPSDSLLSRGDPNPSPVGALELGAQACLPPAPKPSNSQPRRDLDSALNIFHIFRRYHAADFPSHDPDNELSLQNFSDISAAETTALQPSSYGPYPNKSSYLLGEWYWKGVQKSNNDFTALLKVLKDPEFSLQDIAETKWNTINQQLGSGDSEEQQDAWIMDVGWKPELITLTIPFQKNSKQPGNQPFQAGTFYHRSITSILHDRLSGIDGQHFHFEPYELYWQPHPDKAPERVFGELYTSPEFIRVHQELQNSPPEIGCDLPRIVVGLLFSSDVTHLAQFGDAKLWPVYLFFGNDSKYRRSKPGAHLANHLAYLQAVGSLISHFTNSVVMVSQLPDYFDDFAESHTGKAPRREFKTFCHRMMFHEQWKSILDDEFIEAYLHGIIITCFDKIRRRFYPRIFIYIADYPEK